MRYDEPVNQAGIDECHASLKAAARLADTLKSDFDGLGSVLQGEAFSYAAL